MRAINVAAGLLPPSEIIQLIADVGFSISELANAAIMGIAVSQSKAVHELVAVTISELGCTDGASTGEILEAGITFGFRPCSVEMAAHLRLKYLDQPAGERLQIAMEQTVDEYGGCRVLVVANDDCGAHLRMTQGYRSPGQRWSGEDLWVFDRTMNP